MKAAMDKSSSALNTSDLDLSNYENIAYVQLVKGSHGLGFAIMDGTASGTPGIFVKTLIAGGPASEVSVPAYCLTLPAPVLPSLPPILLFPPLSYPLHYCLTLSAYHLTLSTPCLLSPPPILLSPPTL